MVGSRLDLEESPCKQPNRQNPGGGTGPVGKKTPSGPNAGREDRLRSSAAVEGTAVGTAMG